jgi:MFS superfamily sulfate permease-like transporter
MKFAIPFRPKLADTLKNYSKQDFYHDLIAGLTVGIVALPSSDSPVFLTTLALTPFVDLILAVELGVGIATLLIVKRISETSQITAGGKSSVTEGSPHSLVGKEVPSAVLIFRVFGAFCSRVVGKLDNEVKRANEVMHALASGSRTLSQGTEVTTLTSGDGKPNS